MAHGLERCSISAARGAGHLKRLVDSRRKQANASGDGGESTFTRSVVEGDSAIQLQVTAVLFFDQPETMNL
jgi:hypothetical protein